MGGDTVCGNGTYGREATVNGRREMEGGRVRRAHTFVSFSLFSPPDDNMKIMTKEGCVKDVYKAMATHCDCRELVDAACSAMWSLSSDGM